MNSKEVIFTIPGKPQGKDRPRGFIKTQTVGNGLAAYKTGLKIKRTVGMITTQKTVQYEYLIGVLAKQQMAGKEPFSCPMRVDILLFYPISKSWTKVKKNNAHLGKMVPTVKPDIDNCTKAIFDALNHIVWVDDTQVVDKHVSKHFSDNPRVEVRITPLSHLLSV